MLTSAHLNRQPRYQIQTIILPHKKQVIKKALDPKAIFHLKKIHHQVQTFSNNKNLPFNIPQHKLNTNQLIIDYIPGFSFLYLIEESLFYHNFTQATQLLQQIVQLILKLPETNFTLPSFAQLKNLHYTTFTSLDLTADNFILTPKNEIFLIDLEWWVNHPLPKEYLIWRLLTFTSIRLKEYIYLWTKERKKVIALNTYLPVSWLAFLDNYFDYHPYFARFENQFQNHNNLFQAGYISPTPPTTLNTIYQLKEKLTHFIWQHLPT